MKYKDFLQTKELMNIDSGFDIKLSDIKNQLFDFQKVIVRWALKKGKAACFLDTGLGKGHPYGSKILTPTGWVTIEKIKINDNVISAKGKIQKVIGVYPKEKIDTYRFHFSDRCSFVVDKDHLHIVKTNNDRARGKKWRILSTTEILSLNNLRYSSNKNSNGGRNYNIPVVKPILFTKKKLKIHPYLIGVLLGDGSFRNQYIISTNDVEIIERVKELLPKGITIVKKRDHAYDYKIITGLSGNRYHWFKKIFIKFGLAGKLSDSKFVPKEYLYSDVSDRIELLRGLMDTDGYIGECGTCQFYTVSDQLSKDVLFLIRSLGGIPTYFKKKTSYKKNGIKINCKDCHILTFSLKTFNPFYLSRKRKRYNHDPRDNGRWIDRIEYENKQKTICLAVDSPDRSYVVENFIVTHNTILQLEWSRHIVKKEKKPIIILAPLAVSEQTVEEGRKFGIKVNLCASQDDVKNGINITNYEKIRKFQMNKFVGVVTDESSCLKNFTSKYRNLIIESFTHTKYKLACTATPSPNDFMELGNHSEFLNIMTRVEMLSMFFINDTSNIGTWRLKGHVKDNMFWKWLSTWSVMIVKPSDIGFSDKGFILPKLNYIEHIIKSKQKPVGRFFNELASDLNDRRKIRKKTIQPRCNKAKKIVDGYQGNSFVIWCGLNKESETLSKLINNSVEITGSQSNEQKIKSILGFAHGKIKRVITKSKITGFGINWQVCNNAIFVGLNDSFESLYQSIRRIWRFGQKKETNIHIIIEEREGSVLKNLKRKDKQARQMQENMIKHMSEFTKKEVLKTRVEQTEYNPTIKMEIPKWLKGK